MRGRLLIIAAAGLLLTACADDMSDLRQYADEVTSRPGTGIPPIPEFEPYESFTYRSTDLRDPFEPRRGLAEVAAAEDDDDDGIRPDRERPREPLERYPLDSLRMVGTLSLEGRRHGLIRTPDGTVHQVIAGNYMGENHGRIESVEETAVRLTEIIPDGEDGWMERSAAVGLGE